MTAWDPTQPYPVDADTITWQHATPAAVRAHRHGLQRALLPGGQLVLEHPKRGRACAKLLRPYFEGGTPTKHKRFQPVVARERRIVAIRRGRDVSPFHFDELAPSYASEIPEHLAKEYLERKLERLQRAGVHGLGVELGCGMGPYCVAAEKQLQVQMIQADRFKAVVTQAKRTGLPTLQFDAQRLPFDDASLDFVYTINMLHHLKRGEQDACLNEVARVLKPGGSFLVFEMNLRNPAMRVYMRHIFPRLRDIDRGDEEFLHPNRVPVPADLSLAWQDYYTFLPDFTPKPLVRIAKGLESILERSPLRIWSAHYTNCYTKESSP